MKKYKIDQYFEFTFNTQRFDTGAATDADATPTYRVYEENNDTVIDSGNCAKRDDANTTGYYYVRGQCTTALGYEAGKTYEVRVAATVNSVSGAAVVGRLGIVSDMVWDSLEGGTDKLQTDAVEISSDSTAADNLESASDGGSYNLGGGAVVAASVTGAVGSVTGAVGSVTGAVGSVTGAVGSVTGSVGSVVATVSADLVSILGTALTETAGLIAGAFKKFFNVAAPTATALSLPDAVPGAAGGLITTNGTVVNQTVSLTAGHGLAVEAGGNLAAVKAKTDNLPSGFKKNVAVTIEFPMYLAGTDTLATGKTVTLSLSKDGAAPVGSTNAPVEVGTTGKYKVDLIQAETNYGFVGFIGSSAGCDQTPFTIYFSA